jgi:heme/copper-type cytochrome/quinol oxidase subunit 2
MRNTQTITKRTISVILVVMLFSANNALAQNQSIGAEDKGPMHNLIFLMAALFFIIGFTTLFILKLRDDNKNYPKQNKSPQMPVRHPNHYGRRRQLNH